MAYIDYEQEELYGDHIIVHKKDDEGPIHISNDEECVSVQRITPYVSVDRSKYLVTFPDGTTDVLWAPDLHHEETAFNADEEIRIALYKAVMRWVDCDEYDDFEDSV